MAGALGQYPGVPRPGRLDSDRAYRQGWKADMLANLSQNYRPFTSGGQNRQQAQQQNFQNDMTYSKEVHRRQQLQTIQDEKDKAKKIEAKAYTDWFRSVKGHTGGLTMSQFLTLTPADQSDLMMTGSDLGTGHEPTKAMKEMRLIRKLRGVMNDKAKPEWERKEAETDIAELREGRRGPTTTEQDDVRYQYNPSTQEFEPIVKGKTAAQIQEQSNVTAAQRAAGIEEEKGIAKIDVAFRESAATEIPILADAINESKGLLEAMKEGQYTDVGPIEGRFKKYWEPDTAKLQVKAISQALENLKITNLAPVTENELALVQEMYAGIGSDPKANMAKLEEAISMLDRKMKIIEGKRDYWQKNNGTLKGYNLGSGGWLSGGNKKPAPKSGWSIKR